MKDEFAILEDKISLEESIPVVIDNHDKSEEEEKVEETEKKEEKIFVRPRFVKEELNITKKVLVVVMNSEDWMQSQIMMKFYNDSLRPHISDITWLERPSAGLDILDVMKKISDLPSPYQFYMIVPSSTLVISRSLLSLLEPLSSSREVFLGEDVGEGVCSVHSGLLLSHNLVMKMKDNMDWCYRNKVAYDQSLNLQNCIFNSAMAKCSSNTYKSTQYTSQLASLDGIVSGTFYPLFNPE